MKQKKIGNKLYVFDLEAYVITADTDAEVVYVQNHVYDAFKALNPTLNIKRYNYNVIGVNKPEWYDYIAQDDDNSGNTQEPAFVPTTYSFESFSSNDHSVDYGTGKVQTLEEQPVEGYTGVIVTENSFDQYVDTPFVGRTFYISNSAQPADGLYWTLYEYDTTLIPTEVDVKVYNEDQIPSQATPSEQPVQNTLSFINQQQTINLYRYLYQPNSAITVDDDLNNPNNLSPLTWNIMSTADYNLLHTYVDIYNGALSFSSVPSDGTYHLEIEVIYYTDANNFINATKEIIINVSNEPQA